MRIAHRNNTSLMKNKGYAYALHLVPAAVVAVVVAAVVVAEDVLFCKRCKNRRPFPADQKNVAHTRIPDSRFGRY